MFRSRMSSAPLASIHRGARDKVLSGGAGRQPVYLTRLITQLESGTEAAINCPLSCGWLRLVTSALGARIVPCQATPKVTLNPVASGRFHMIPAPVGLPERLMYMGAIERIVAVFTLISAVAPGWVRLITIPAACASWAASTVNTFRPVAVPVSVSAP